MQRDDAKPRDEAIEKGATMIVLPPEEVARWKEASAPTIEKWVAEMARKRYGRHRLYNRAIELIEENTGK